MASHESGTCCFVGFKHEGEPKGTMRKVGGCEPGDAYLAAPKEASSKAILLIPDFMGYPSVPTAEEVKGVKGLLMIAAAENDQMFLADKRQETEEILKQSGHPFSMTVYNQVEHGFGLRADLNNTYHKFVSEASFLQAVNWFEYFLKA